MNSSDHRLLGVNIDHVATLRQARRTDYPCPIRAARQCVAAGADLITLHLREDARHIQESDLERLCADRFCRINLELAPVAEMADIACRYRPDDCCLVPERREELTTEGGLDARAGTERLRAIVDRLHDAGIRVSLFIEPERAQLDVAADLGVRIVELHTGGYANTSDPVAALASLADAAEYGHGLGLQVNAGHGLTLANIGPVASIRSIAEFNIGHFIVSEALFVGFGSIVSSFKTAILQPFKAS